MVNTTPLLLGTINVTSLNSIAASSDPDATSEPSKYAPPPEIYDDGLESAEA